MRLPILNLDKYTTLEQILKINEEFKEFRRSGQKETLEEGLDVIQSIMGYFFMIYEPFEIEQGFKAHYKKLEDRVGTERGHDFEGHIDINFNWNIDAIIDQIRDVMEAE